MMTEQERHIRFLRTVLHECGHFIVASALGVETSEPVIQIDKDGYVGGHCTVETEDSPYSHKVMVAIAGHVAEAVWGFFNETDPEKHVANCFEEDPPKYLCNELDMPFNDAAKAGDLWRVYLPETVAILEHHRDALDAKIAPVRAAVYGRKAA
jgi:hypothetical protein